MKFSSSVLYQNFVLGSFVVLDFQILISLFSRTRRTRIPPSGLRFSFLRDDDDDECRRLSRFCLNCFLEFLLIVREEAPSSRPFDIS